MQGRFLGCVGGCPLAGFALPRPGTGSANKLALCGVEGDAGLVQVIDRETGRAAATDTGAAIFHGVVAGMVTALGLDPLSELQLVGELQPCLLRVE
jgi:hypothetical protein